MGIKNVVKFRDHELLLELIIFIPGFRLFPQDLVFLLYTKRYLLFRIRPAWIPKASGEGICYLRTGAERDDHGLQS